MYPLHNEVLKMYFRVFKMLRQTVKFGIIRFKVMDVKLIKKRIHLIMFIDTIY